MIPKRPLTNGSHSQPKSTHQFVRSLGVPDLAPHTSPFDPGYDVATVISHLEQSHHLISRLKISMTCWLIADEAATRSKIDAARRLGVPLVTGGGPFEIAEDKGKLESFLELAASLNIDRVEAPNKRSQFDFLSHFGNTVNLSNVRLEELLRVEIYRRGLHSDAYARFLAPGAAGADRDGTQLRNR